MVAIAFFPSRAVSWSTGDFLIWRRDDKWVGYYVQCNVRADMDLKEFSIGNGAIRGRGADEVGKFTLEGSIDPEGIVEFVKKYIGMHQVLYRGMFDGKDSISGKWQL